MMNTRRVYWLSWSMWTLSAVFNVIALIFHTASDPGTWVSNIFGALVLFAFATTGALITSRRPQNRIGWLLLLGSLIWTLGAAMLEYGVYALTESPYPLPASNWMAWYGFGVRGFAFGLIAIFVPLLFPNGELPSRRWRWAAWLAVCVLLLFSLSSLLGSQSGDLRLSLLHNPLGIEVPGELAALLDTLNLSLLLAVVVSGCAAFARFRRANAEERQQLKWFAYAALWAIIIVVALLIGVFVEDQYSTTWVIVGTLLFNLMLAGFPIAVGIAVFKYRLWDIDLIIRRTLIYAVLTAMLAFVYFGSVVLLQQLFRALTGQQQSEIVTVVSTLAIAALFVPLHRRVQDTIDRRFFRRKYDAAKVLAQFAATARDEVDLQKLTEGLLDVVDETMQPTQVSLWLKKTDDRRRTTMDGGH